VLFVKEEEQVGFVLEDHWKEEELLQRE